MAYTCENIGLAERQKRVRIANLSFAIAAVVGACLLAFGAPRAWRLLALLPLWIGALGFVQAKMGTCVALAARGVRNMDAGDEPIADAGERQALVRRARIVHGLAVLIALTLDAALLVLP